MSIKSASWPGLALIFAVSGALQPGLTEAAQGDKRPNIVLLVVDDMGYADLPRFGGEVDTPNIDKLADAGVTFTNFHVLPSCSPSRSILLTSVDNHLNGLGTMPERLNAPGAVNQRGQPGYLAYLNDRVATGPELLRDAGYHTYMAGKWHLAEEEESPQGFRRGTWPLDRGFERSTGVLEGGSDQFGGPQIGPEKFHYFEDDHILTQLPVDFYTTKTYTQKIVEYIDGNKNDGKPFFVYWAPNTPHWPFQAPQQEIDKYLARGTYEQGWDAVRQQRFERMKQLGLIPANLDLPPRAPGVPAWDNPGDPAWTPLLNQVLPFEQFWGIQNVADLKRTFAKEMAVYTGMIDYIDVQIGVLINYLKDIGEYENTVFMFISDNGGDAANLSFARPIQQVYGQLGVDNHYENIGRPHSQVSYPLGWAQVSNGPLFGAKLTVAEAGTRAPLIVAYPAGNIPRHRRSDAFVSVRDILPTVLRYAKVKHPAGTRLSPAEEFCTVAYKDRTICPMNGKSMTGLLRGETDRLYGNGAQLGFELFGTVNKALFEGPWKILRLGDGIWGAGVNQPWKLFNLARDPRELVDLSAQRPGRLQRMTAAYDRYEQRVGFIPVVQTPAAGQAAREAAAPRRVMD